MRIYGMILFSPPAVLIFRLCCACAKLTTSTVCFPAQKLVTLFASLLVIVLTMAQCQQYGDYDKCTLHSMQRWPFVIITFHRDCNFSGEGQAGNSICVQRGLDWQVISPQRKYRVEI